MRNVRFAVIFAAFLIINGIAFARNLGPDILIIFCLSLPLLILLAEQATGKHEETSNFRDRSPASMLPYALALVCVARFTFFVYSMVSKKIITFYDPIMRGWELKQGAELLILDVLAAACALAIWSSNHYNRSREMKADDRLWMGGLFFAERPELTRIFVFFCAYLFTWAVSVQALRPLVRSWPYEFLVIAMARTTIPLVLLVAGAMIRLPMSLVALVAAVGVYLMAGAVLGYRLALVFMAPQVIVIAVFSVLRYVDIGLKLPPLAMDNAAKAEKKNG